MKTCLALMMSGVFLVLAACSGHGSESMPATNNGEKILNVYAWSDYIAPAAISNFEKETGIEVRYDTYDNNEVLETKLLTGHSNYDIVIPSENFFGGQLRAGVYRALDKQLLPNLVNADPEIMRRMAIHDPGNLHAIPYMWSTTGLGYNIDRVQARLGPDVTNSWALLFDPQNAQKLRDAASPSLILLWTSSNRPSFISAGTPTGTAPRTSPPRPRYYKRSAPT
jgi:putrescine transport system substrate-binding protein